MDLTKLKELLQGVANAEEILKEINSENGKDVTKAKGDLDEKIKELETLNAKIAELESSKATGDEFKTKFEELTAQIAKEKADKEEADKQAKIEQGFKDRFNALNKDKKFRDELTENAVYGLFKTALNDEANKTKSDNDILEELVKDKNYYVNPNNPAYMDNNNRQDSISKTEQDNIRKIMGLSIKEEK